MTKPRQPLPGDLQKVAQGMHLHPPEGDGWEPVMQEHRLRYRRRDLTGKWQYEDGRTDEDLQK
jgi:hypothetical protein